MLEYELDHVLSTLAHTRQEMSAKFSIGFSKQELEEQFRELDVDGNGKVNDSSVHVMSRSISLYWQAE